jgi:hypothetical protein
MPSYLLVIGDREALGWILSTGRMAFPSARRAEVAALQQGHELFLYTTRGAFKNPTRDRGRGIGTAQVTSPVRRLEEPVRFGEREYPIGCDLAIGPLAPFGSGLELAPLVPSLSAFDGVRDAWSTRLRRPLVRLSADDAAVLRNGIEHLTHEGTDPAYTRWYLERSASAARAGDRSPGSG